MPNDFYEFGPFQLDTKTQILRRGEQVLPLGGREFEVLHALLKRDGHLAGRETLIAEIWGDANLLGGHNNLSQQIGGLRRKLGKDDAGQDYIRTTPNKGYFLATEIRIVQPELFCPEPQKPSTSIPPLVRRSSWKVGISVALAFAVCASGLFAWKLFSRQMVRRSIVVLSFQERQFPLGDSTIKAYCQLGVGLPLRAVVVDDLV